MSKTHNRDFRNTFALIVGFLNDHPSEHKSPEAVNQLRREFLEDIKLATSAVREKKLEGSGRLASKSANLSIYPALCEGREVGSLILDNNKLSPGRCRVTVVDYELAVDNHSTVTDQLKGDLYNAAHWASINGQLQRLRQCKHCQQFFALTGETRRFCSKQCGRAWDRKDAKQRVKDSRKRQSAE